MPPGDPDQERIIRERLARAREALARAKEQYKQALAGPADPGAVETARRARDAALAAYQRAIRQFSAYVMKGEPPARTDETVGSG